MYKKQILVITSNKRVTGMSLTSSVILDFLFRVRDTSLCLTLFLFWLSTELFCRHKYGMAMMFCKFVDQNTTAVQHAQ